MSNRYQMSPYRAAGRAAGQLARGSTAKQILGYLAFIGLCASAVFWYPIQSHLAGGQKFTAGAFTAIIVLAPPTLVAFWVPWSPGAQLLQKIHLKTVGQWVCGFCATFLLLYSGWIMYLYWLGQPAINDPQTGAINYQLIYWQIGIGIIGFTIIPALLWTPVLTEELVETLRQANIVKEFELYTEKRIAILRAESLQVEEIALKKWADMLPEERAYLVQHGNKLAKGIEETLTGVGRTMMRVADTSYQFQLKDEARSAIKVIDTYARKLLPEEEVEEGVWHYEDGEPYHGGLQDPWEADARIQQRRPIERPPVPRQRQGGSATGRLDQRPEARERGQTFIGKRRSDQDTLEDYFRRD